jgi:hypothetical protein
MTRIVVQFIHMNMDVDLAWASAVKIKPNSSSRVIVVNDDDLA